MVVQRDASGPFPNGLVEVYATAGGFAWGKALVRVEEGAKATLIALVEAKPFRLVVESHLGLPLEGVRIEVTPTDDGEPLVIPPEEVGDRTDANGMFRLEHLPDREYQVRLSLPGYHTETLRGVRLGWVTYFATLVAEK